MFHGLRVVRGPDWKWSDQDGGIGCIGTVVEPVVEVPCEDTATCVWVRWDSGKTANYRVTGKRFQFDLRIYDNAQIGVKHPNVICAGCHEDGIIGIRWKCVQCYSYDLCSTCYHGGEHDLYHHFERIDSDNFAGVHIPLRVGSARCQASGIFPDARVVRGPDWTWGNHDGGKGTFGIVCNIINDIGIGSYRSTVSVKWPSGQESLYRRGHKGKMDVIYVVKETAGEFYIEHLPVFDTRRLRAYVTTGDNVRLVKMDIACLKKLQLESCGWDEEIANCRGKVGEVIVVDKDGDIKVKFGDSSHFIHPLCLVMVKEGNGVSVFDDGDEDNTALFAAAVVKYYSKWDGLLKDFDGSTVALVNAAAEGNSDKVKEILRKHPDTVKFQTKEKGQTALQAAAHCGHLLTVKALTEGNAPLELKDEDGDTALTFAVLGNEPDTVKFLLLAGSNINTSNKKGNTPLHFAAAKGYETCVETLLKHDPRKCKVNCKEENGYTPLFIAIVTNNAQIIQMLVDFPGVDLKLTNNAGFNCLHFAAVKGNAFAVKMILRAVPSMINLKKPDGFTALHIAALNNHPDVVLELVNRGNCSKNLTNGDGSTALHLAVNKCHNKSIEALVSKGADVNARDKNGDTSLHIVMVKASMQDVLGASPLGQLLDLVERIGYDRSFGGDEKSNLVGIGVYLIKHGADIYIRNKKDKTVLGCIVNPSIESLVKKTYDSKRLSAPTKGRCKVS